MYMLLLCWRYLRTRYLAMVCIVSVMLGVCTLIVVNSVMGGFSTKLRERLHALLSDVVVEAYDYNGFADPEGKMALIRSDPFLDQRIAAMSPTLEIFAMIQFTYRGMPMARPIRLIGVDPEGRSRVGGFAEHLLHNRQRPTFDLQGEALARYEEQHRRHGLFFNPNGPDVPGLPDAPRKALPDERHDENGNALPPPQPPPSRPFVPEGVILGHAIAHYRVHDVDTNGKRLQSTREMCSLELGDDVVVTTVSGQRLSPVNARLTVCDYFRSEMSEYDANYVFVSLPYLQKLRTMEDRVTNIQIRLRDGADRKQVVLRLQQLFGGTLQVLTWEDKQGPLLAAISVEKGILNVLLFLIIAVAGFGILAIFSMIVVEKTRDIGVLKALGASNGGVLKIFLGYGLLLGLVGAALGTLLGVAITTYINQIEWFLSLLTGQEIFPRDVYYFDKIPTDIRLAHVLLINLGAVSISVLFSILPALRAALLHPVRALRFE
jgi:lipoprotein-releasing system permease protein